MSKWSLLSPVNSKQYTQILHDFYAIVNALAESSIASWFMKDNSCVIGLWKLCFTDEYFDIGIIDLIYSCSTRKGIQLSPYAPQLSQWDFFLWGELRDAVYLKNPEHLSNLKESMTSVQKICANFLLQ